MQAAFLTGILVGMWILVVVSDRYCRACEDRKKAMDDLEQILKEYKDDGH